MEKTDDVKNTWMKVLEYATSPKHGTLSRKQRKGVSVMINGDFYENSILFLGESFVRVTETKEGKSYNTYYDWSGIKSLRTVSEMEEAE